MSETNGSKEYDVYLFSSADNRIVAATKELILKTASGENITARAREVVARILQVFEALPSVVADFDLQLQVTGPCQTYGSHEINHWWNIEIEDGSLCVTSGGYFYRPETGGESFTSMIWRASPGLETEYSDYTDTLALVDDAKPFDLEVQAIDFAQGGYSLTLFENGEELEDDGSDVDEQEDDEIEVVFETFDGELADQMTLNEAVRLLESAGVGCAWANREMTALYSVDLKELAVTDSVYKLFEHIPTLKSLEARNTDISDRSLVFISHLDSLEWLCLRRTAVTDEGLRHLKRLTSLQHLDLVGTAVAGPGLLHLKGLANLRELFVKGFQHHDQWLDMLRRELTQCRICLM